MTVSENLSNIHERIAKACGNAGRSVDEVDIIAVTKYVSTETARAALEAGVRHLGENRSDGFLTKWEALHGEADLHFIGTLQSRKVKEIIDKVNYVHSLDRLSLAKEIEKRAEGQTRCFIQVNVSGEVSKHGMEPDEVIPFIRRLADYQNIKIIGLMTMAPHSEDPERTRPVFRRLRALRDEVRAANFGHAPCTELSMGMSNDYPVAIEEGATFVRIGTTLVGSEL